MKNYYIYIYIYCSLLFPQFSTNFLNGFGERLDIVSTFSESMGGMWLNNKNIDISDPLVPSSIHKTNLTILAISSSFQGINSDIYKSNLHSIDFINFSFPIRNNGGVGIGFSPYVRSNYIFSQASNMISGTEFSGPLSSSTSYVIDGGISRLSLALSKGIAYKNIDISTGLRWNILFGNQQVNSTTILNKISYDQSGNEELILAETLYSDQNNHFNAYLYEFDSRIATQNNSISFLIGLLDNFQIDTNKANQLFSYSKKYLLNKIQLDKFALGYMYTQNNQHGLAFEIHFKSSIDYPEEASLFNSSYPSQLSFHNGVYKKFDNIKSDTWDSINLSAGYSYKIIKFASKDLNDISFSLGCGLLFNDWKNNIDLSFTFGSNENIIAEVSRDNYYKLSLAVFSGDQWFKKRRRQ